MENLESSDYLPYFTWVTCYKDSDRQENVINFPDFDEQKNPIYISANIPKENFASTITSIIKVLTSSRLRAGRILDLSKPESYLEKVYPPDVQRSKIAINIWDIINAVYPREPLPAHLEKFIKAQPKARKPEETTFWLVVEKDPVDGSSTVYFPELFDPEHDKHCHTTVYGEDVHEIAVAAQKEFSNIIAQKAKNGGVFKSLLPPMKEYEVQQQYPDCKAFLEFNLDFEEVQNQLIALETQTLVLAEFQHTKKEIEKRQKEQFKFWYILRETQDDFVEDTLTPKPYTGEKTRYEIIIPELDEEKTYDVYGFNKEEIHEQVDDIFLRELKAFMEEGNGYLPKKLPPHYSNSLCSTSDELRQYRLSPDDFTDILSETQNTRFIRLNPQQRRGYLFK